MPTKEFREFFLRNTRVTTGAKKDQESNYPFDYLVNGVKKFNRFLKNHFPSQDVFTKLFESITFKLNQEDTASSTVQGLVKKATDTETEIRTANPNTDFTKSVAPHQIPEIVLATDGNDAVVSTTIVGNLTLTVLKRTIAGLFRRNYMLEVSGLPKGLWLAADFITGTTVLAVIGAGGNLLRHTIVGGKVYKFEADLFINPDNTGQSKLNVTGTATSSQIIYEIHYNDDSTNQVDWKARVTALNTPTSITPGISNGHCKIVGTIRCAGSGTLDIQFAQAAANNTSRVLLGSSFMLQEIIP